MTNAVSRRTEAWGPRNARRVFLAGGLAALLSIAIFTAARGADPVEVLAAAVYIPIFLSLFYWKVPGGLLAGALATAVYTAARAQTASLLGWEALAPVVVLRGVGYLLFGVLGGWGAAQIERSLTKLENHDEIDDETGLYNARFFISAVDLEMARSRRYGSPFSVCIVDVSPGVLTDIAERKVRSLMRRLADGIREILRTSDRAVHVHEHTDRRRFGVVLPETNSEGADTFAARLYGTVRGFLSASGVGIGSESLSVTVVTFPDKESLLVDLREDVSKNLPQARYT